MLVNEEYLSHYGVKGMKWGVRKIVREVSGNLRRKKKKVMDTRNAIIKKRMARDVKKVEARRQMEMATNSKKRKEALSTHDPEVLKKNMHLLTYSELDNQYKRLLLEKKVRELTPKQQSKGKKAVESAFKFINSDAGQQLVKTAVDTLEKKIGDKPLSEAIDDVSEAMNKDASEKENKKKKDQ